MPSNESSSSSTQSTSSTTTDARVGADNGAVVIQEGGSQNISFSPEVSNLASKVVNSITDFSSGVVSTAGEILKKNIEAQEKTTNAVLDFGKSALAASPATPSSASAGIIAGQSVGDFINAFRAPLLIAAIGISIYFLSKSKKG